MSSRDAIPGPETAVPPPAGGLTLNDVDWLEALPEAAFILDPGAKRVLHANARLEELTGENRPGREGLHAGRLLHLDDPGLWAKALADALDGSPGGSGEPAGAGWLQRKDRLPLPVEVSVSPFRRGKEPYFLVSVRPLRSSTAPGGSGLIEEALRDLFDNSHDVIYAHDLEGRFLSVNRAALRTLGYTLEEALALRIQDVVDPEYHGVIRSRMEEKLRSGGFSPLYEVLCRSKEGRPVWLEVSTRLLLRGGAPEGVQGVARDVTGRKLAEGGMAESRRAAEEQRNLLERMIDQNPYAIAFWNPDGSFHRCNEAFKSFLGMMPGSGYNLLRDTQIRRSGLIDPIRRAFRGEAVHIDRARYDIGKTPGHDNPAKPVWARVTLFPILNSSGAIQRVVTYFQDITRQLEAEEAREALERQLVEAQKLEAIGTLAGGVAHDFNNILTGIMGYLDLMRGMAGERLIPFLDKVERLTQRGSEVTRQLLAYARKSRIEPRVHDMNNTLKEVGALLKQTLDRRIEVELKPSAAPATVLADPGQMSQVLLNLCVNARDAVEERIKLGTGGTNAAWEPRIILETRVHTVTEAHCRAHPEARPGRFVRVNVWDNGTGMDAMTRERIFEPFFTTKAVGKGTGLGLATIFGIVNQHGGWLGVHSKPGSGSVFHVYLPAVDSPAAPLSEAAAMVKARGGNETLMLVDDEPAIREMGRESLGALGYKILLARDGREALDTFGYEHDRIDLVILDLTMPRLSGREVMPRLLEINPKIKVVVASGYFIEQASEEFRELGAAAFIQKPYNPGELARAVREVLDSEHRGGPPAA